MESAKAQRTADHRVDAVLDQLLGKFGDHLLFPPEFVGRGDMSRGALMLKAARLGRELSYLPVEDARRHGPRAPSVARQDQSGTLGGFPNPPATTALGQPELRPRDDLSGPL